MLRSYDEGTDAATTADDADGAPRIGIALGGGSARGLTHIAYIEAMDELGLRPAAIAGCSIGALIGAGWAAGLTGARIREYAYEFLGTPRAIMGRLWSKRLRNLGALFSSGLSLQLEAADVVENFMPADFVRDFAELKVPLSVVATDFNSWHQVVFNSGPLQPAIAGSIAIPSLFRPVAYGAYTLVDGGVVNPLPLDAAAPGADILIGIDVNGDPLEYPADRVPTAIDIGLGSAQIMMHNLIAHTMAAYPPDLYFRPHVPAIGAYEFWRVREVIEAGERDKDRFKRELGNAVEDFIAGRQRTI